MKKLIWIFFPLMSTLAIAQKADDLTKFGKVITVNSLKEKLTIFMKNCPKNCAIALTFKDRIPIASEIVLLSNV